MVFGGQMTALARVYLFRFTLSEKCYSSPFSSVAKQSEASRRLLNSGDSRPTKLRAPLGVSTPHNEGVNGAQGEKGGSK